jgi:hypothetical protein
VRHGQALDDLLRGVRFRARRFQELEARRHRVEQVAQFDPRAFAARSRFGGRLDAAVDRDLPGGIGAARAAGDRERPTAPIDGNASPRKPKEWMWTRSSSGQLGGGVALDRQRQLVRVMPLPSSSTTIRARPPSRRWMSIRRAPASSAFSTSSFTTEQAAPPPRRRRSG